MKIKELMWVCVCCFLFTVGAWASPVPDTGQSKCYNATVEIPCPSSGQPFYGQDAQYTINPMSFTKLDGSGNVLPDSATSWVMVRDNVTGLIWENKTDDGTIHDKDNKYTWYDSNPATNGGYAGTPGDGTDTEDFISALNSAHFGGYSDWRLPTTKELMSIVNDGISSPAIDAGYFPNTVSSFYWASTTYAYGTYDAWGVGFGYGNADYNYKLGSYYVRAVRGGQSSSLDHLTIGSFDTVNSRPSDDASTATGIYTDNSDGTVTDTSTGLRWQRAGPSYPTTWEQALAYCEDLNLGGYTDWRLPTSKELQSLVDYSRYDPAINTTYFPSTAASWYWSSTTYVGNTYGAWCVDFGYGGVNDTSKNLAGYVRAVRGGQFGPLYHSVISVSPASRDVAKDSGTTTFSVSNTGTGTMLWTAAVTPASSWLSITSGASGADAGTINCGFTENPNTSARTATIRVTAAGATGSPVDVTVTQAPTVSGYVDNGDGTVTDTPNGLMWQQATAPNTYDWAQAISYCESLSFAGYTDWRLPTIDELKSLLALGWHPTINPIFFPDTAASWYWSGVTHISDTNSAWVVYFGGGGDVNYNNKSGSFYVRAVRGGQPGHSVISVSPANRDVTKDAGATTFSVSNTGTGTMPWTAAVTDSWLSITSGASGTDSGTINCSFTANTITTARTATIRVTAPDATGSPVDVTVTQAPAPATAPGVPTIGTATAGNAQATVSFTPPASNGGSPITGYTVTSNHSGKTATNIASPITIVGLTNGIAYTFTVIATNVVGSSAPSASSNSVTPCTVPGAPTIGTAIAGNAQATVSFTPPASNGGSPITGYTVTSNPDGKTATGSASPITVTGLTNGAACTFTVIATNAAGSSAPSASSNSVIPFTVPGAPTIGTATAGNAQATVSFTPPASNGGSLITGYTVTSNPSGKTATGIVSPITITGLTNGTAYTFVVIATNAAGSSAPSASSNSVIPCTIPGVPTIGTATAGNAQATVSFTPPASDGGSLITGYTATSSPGGKTATGSASPIVVLGLTNGAAYTFVVIATNVGGSSAPSASSNSVIPFTVPGAPTIGTATAGNAQATVSFTPPASNGGSLITGYTVTSNPDGKTVTGSASPITITGLTNGTAYTFIVTATNAGGSSAPSASSNSVTPFTVPGVPTIGTATAGNAQATVNFTPPASNGGSSITGYTVTSNPGVKTATGIANPITITGLTNGTSYTFTVIATNAAGSSAPSASSNSVIPFTVPGAPTIGTATAGNAQATVNFTPPASNGGSSITGYTVTSNPGGKTATGSANPITITGLVNDTPYTFTVTATNAAGTSLPSTASNSVIPSSKTPIIGSNSINAMDVVKITDMSGLLPDGGMVVTVSAWDKDGKQLTEAGYAPPLSIINHGTSSVLGRDLEDRFPDGAPAAYSFSVESAKMFITNVNNSIDGAVKVPIIYSNGLSNFVSNSIGTRNTLKLTDMSGTIDSSGIAITITAWDASGKAIPESTSAETLRLYSHGTTTIAGSSLPARFLPGVPMTYQFTIASPKLIVSNVKNSSDGTLNIPTVYTVGVSSFVSNSIGYRNTIYISDFSGTLDTDGAAISVRAWDVSGTEIPESVSASSYKIFNYETVTITGAELGSRFSSGTPITYQFTVDSSKVVITNVKSSTDGSINIPTVHTSGITNYTTNYVSDLNTIRITDMSGGIPAGGASITITARDGGGILIPEYGSAIALKLNNHGTTTIEGSDLRSRFPSGTPVTYEFSIDSPIAVITNLTESTGGTINIPAVFTLGPCGGI